MLQNVLPGRPATLSTKQSCNKSAQSNLERGPRCGAVAYVRRKVPTGYNGTPEIHPRKYPFPWTDQQTALSASSIDTSDLQCQTASGSDPLFFHNALHRPTDAHTYVQTDRSSTGNCDNYRPLRYESDAA